MTRSRHGVALIIAISVLAALLFLALPFVFSQSSSVAGARASAWDGSARRGSDRAAGLATALTVYATGLHRSPALVSQLSIAQQTYVQLPLQINDSAGAIRYPSYVDNAWRLVVESGADWQTTGSLVGKPDGRDVIHGAVIEDESRRIDPNTLGERGWAIVLARAGIVDPFTVYWNWGIDVDSNAMTPNVPTTLASVGGWRMANYGRLARTLSWWRPANSGRFNRLEDLLGADPFPEVDTSTHRRYGSIPFGPRSHDNTGAPVWPPPATSEAVVEATRDGAESDTIVKSASPEAIFLVNGDNTGYRRAPLTQAEVDRLRPYLSFLVPGQGRSGIIDIGTVVAEAPANQGWYGVTTDELSPSAMGVGLSVRPHSSARIRSSNPGSLGDRDLSNRWTAVNDALAIDAPAALNINTVPASSGITRLYSPSPTPVHTPPAQPGWPADPSLTPIASVGAIGRLQWLDPGSGDGTDSFERPPLGILGFGIVAIEGAATARDREGGAVAQRRRRTVVQAVPQERPFEAAWRTQGEMEALILARHGSWIMAGPHPTRRIANWGSEAGDMAALDTAGWIEPAPVCAFSRNRSQAIDWRVPFGLTQAQSWANVLNEVNANNTVGSAPAAFPAQVRSSGLQVGALTAQGLRQRNGDRLAYTTSDTAGPLRFTGSHLDELGSRHVSMRFMLPNVPTTPVVLMEARNQTQGADTSTPADGTPDADTDNQNLWRVEYRPATQQLVMVIANAALPWTDLDRARFGVAGWTTDADVPTATTDARCNPGSFPFAPKDPATRVEFRYLVLGGVKAGQWYHLQAFCAADRPGTHGLILDGVVGRDATRPISGLRTGDHYTWPSLRINSPIAATTPKTTGGSALTTSNINVTYPPDLSLDGILPARGVLRIDDEYFSYTGISGSGGTGTISGVQRARRVNTDQAATIIDPADSTVPYDRIPDDNARWPITQTHVAGALATPGWAQVSSIADQWLRGSATLARDFPAEGVHGTVSGTWDYASGSKRLPGTSGIANVGGGPWPERGYVRFSWLGASQIAAFSEGSGGALRLEWGGDQADLGPINIDDTTAVVTATLISIEVNGAVSDTDVTGDGLIDRLWGSAVQLIDPTTGQCEWVRINETADRDVGVPALVVQGKYLLRWDGWRMDAYGTPTPLDQPRGSMRTPWRSTTPWPATSVVLPVQTSFDLDRLESGDVVTLVPDTIESGTPSVRYDPVQLLVRHAARDGFPAVTTSGGPATDTINEWFALAHAVPAVLPDPITPGPTPVLVPQMALIGRGWAGDDLSMIGNSPARRGSMPRRVLVSAAGGGAARTYIGSSDPRTAGTQDVIIDDLCAGNLTGPADGNRNSSAGADPANAADDVVGGVEIVQINGSYTGTLDATVNAMPIDVTASTNVFVAIDQAEYGLCLINGEAFAYRRIDDTHARLIARGLLGTEMVAHELAPSAPMVPTQANQPPNRVVRPTLPVVRLPIGPVGELCTTITVNEQGTAIDVVEISFASYYLDPPASGFTNAFQGIYADSGRQHLDESPFVLISDPGRTPANEPEVLRMLDHPTQANQRTLAPWLRGLYGTMARPWTANFPDPSSNRLATWEDQDATPHVVNPNAQESDGSQLNPIVIGWWPRFAPGMIASPDSRALRSRSFAWAGFPLRLSGARFDPANIPALRNLGGAGVADVPVADLADNLLEVRALAAGDGAVELFDWDTATTARQSLSSGSNNQIVTPFSWSRFSRREVDGAEMRIHWTANGSSAPTALLKAADQQGRAPRLGATDLQAEAAPPATGTGIRLRCVAPTRILAVEEVR